MSKTIQIASGELVAPRVSCFYHKEPVIRFGCEREHVSPQVGLSLYGPRLIEDDKQHPSTVRVGFIGSGKSIGLAEQWIEDCSAGVAGDGVNLDFPGYRDDRGFYSTISMANTWREKITANEIQAIASLKKRRDRFTESLTLVSEKIQYLTEKDSEPQVIVLAFPDELLKHCKTVDYKDADAGQVHRDFRRAIKAEAMRYRVPTQILLQRTTEATPTSRNVDHKSRCAWNFFTGMHYKVGAAPWGPAMQSRGSLFIGVSFYKPLGTEPGTMQTSVAQAFDERGEGIVLRGKNFRWDETKDGRSPHLDEQQSKELIDEAIHRYTRETGQTPRRIVIHKSSEYWPSELLGFSRALSAVPEFDLVALRYNNRIRLLRQANYPVLRGTQFTVGSRTFLYTTGYVPSIRRFPHGHVPAPLEISEHHGDSSTREVCEEIMALTKLNWNSSFFASAEPITLKFSRTVGGVMKEMPEGLEPRPQFKHYI
tara:strand:+ start:7407 stop:8849 length:1443 start_codon:yes stop_codon:yes gene_type:complete